MHKILIRTGFTNETLAVPPSHQSEYEFLQHCINSLRPWPTEMIGIPLPQISRKLDNIGMSVAAGVLVTASNDSPNTEFHWLAIPKMYQTEFIKPDDPPESLVRFGAMLFLTLSLSRMIQIDTPRN